METIRVKKEKESKFKSTLRWNDKNKKRVLKTTIPAKVVDKLQLTAGDEIIYHIKETSLNVFQCEISFKADHLEHIDKSPRKSASTTDAQMTKTVETKTDANNESKTSKYDGLPFMIDKYKMIYTTEPYDKIQVIDTERDKQVTFIGIGKRDDDEIKSIIDGLKQCKSLEEIEKTLDEYRPPK